MIRTVFALTLVLAMERSPQPTAAAQTPPMPLRLFGEGGRTQPIWVNAKVALTREGTPDPSQFDAGAITALESFLALPAKAGCVAIGPSIRDNAPSARDRSTLDSSISTARFVLEAQVDGVEPGFLHGAPGQLYRLKALKRLKGQTARDFYFIFLPVGEVPLGEKRVCITDPLFPVPSKGKRIVIMSDEPIGPTREFLDVEDPGDVLVETPDGTVGVARHYVDHRLSLRGLSLPAAVELIEQSLPRGGAR